LYQAHVLPAQSGEARVNTVDQHGFIVTTGSHTFAGRQAGQGRARYAGRAKVQETTAIQALA
jgi:hypothetical protein